MKFSKKVNNFSFLLVLVVNLLIILSCKQEVIDTDYEILPLGDITGKKVYLLNINISPVQKITDLRYSLKNVVDNSFLEASRLNASEQINQVDEVLQDTMEKAKTLTAEGQIVSGVYSNGVIRFEKKQDTITQTKLSEARDSSTVSHTEYEFNVGDTRELNCNNSKEQAVCKVEGDYCFIWINENCFDASSINDNDNKLKLEQLEKVAEVFDKIYYPEINIFGDTYKGSENTYNIVPQEKISIYFTDIDNDYVASQKSGVVGYFGANDFWESATSNKDEIFYIDVHFTDKYSSISLSTLAHEFQHMLRYVNKGLKNGSDTWCNEMTSLLCEDMLQSVMELSNDDSVKNRLYEFCSDYYTDGLISWNGKTIDYCTAYAFGAWLVRNYGGAKLLQTMALNDGDFGITLVINSVNTLNETRYSFDELFIQYVTAIPFSTTSATNKTTLNKTVTDIIGEFTYTFKAIDLPNISWYDSGKYGDGLYLLPENYTISNYVKELEPYSFTLQYCVKGSGNASLKLHNVDNENLKTIAILY